MNTSTSAKPFTKKQQREAEQADARAQLLKYLKPGDTVLTVLRHVSRSGMSRRIDLYVVDPEQSRGLAYLSGYAAKLCGWTCNPRSGDGIVVGGCGMDMGFHLVHNLSCELFPDGFGCIGQQDAPRRWCPSNDHSNGDRDYTEHGHRGPQYDGTKESLKHWHSSGGYALRQEWL